MPAYAADTPVRGYKLVASYPHDAQAFTQGLLIDEKSGLLYESTGLTGSSSLRKVRLNDGIILQSFMNDPAVFGEGLALVDQKLIQLTLDSQVAYVYNQSNFQLQNTFNFNGAGWGLTFDGNLLIMSNGSSTLQFRDPSTFAITKTVSVSDQGKAVTEINELEMVEGLLYANIWKTDRIAAIAPATGVVQFWIDLRGLHTFSGTPHVDDVLNGIAYDAKNKRLFVTGKRWSKLYEITVDNATASQDRSPGPVAGGGTQAPSEGGGGCILPAGPRG